MSSATSRQTTCRTAAPTDVPNSHHNDDRYQPPNISDVRPGPRSGRRSTARPSTARPRTGVSTLGVENQEIICAVSESRGISPLIGLAFVNLDTGEAVLSQISDSPTFVRTVHKLAVFNPSVILIVSTAAEPKSKLFSILEESLDTIESKIVLLDRRYWAESTGLDYIQQLAFAEDLEAIKTAVTGNYYAVCCLASALKYVELGMSKAFPHRSLRIKYEPAEGSMMIDLSTIRSLELVQNLTNSKSKQCLYGLLNETLTPMGARLLRSNILQPLTDPDTLNIRYDALEELSTKEQMFFAVRQALKPFLDVDRTLTQLILIPTQPSLQHTEQALNNVILLKQYVNLVLPVFEALSGARASMLQEIQRLCAPENILPVQGLIDAVINEDTTYASQPLDLRNQRTYAVKSGVNGLLDVARQTYQESTEDVVQHIKGLAEEHDLALQTKFDKSRQFYVRLHKEELEKRNLPPCFINVFRKQNWIECQTMDLLKLNQKVADSHSEAISMSDKSVQELTSDVREHIGTLFKICEAVAMLDMLASSAQAVTSQDYVRPQLTDTLAIKAGRHPIREKIQSNKFVPNDIFASPETSRFQIITGENGSGKSTYIRSIALMTVMAQIGSFVPAQYASIRVVRQLLARVSMDDSIETNVSTFAAEMREAAFILGNVDSQSLVVVDELGRGTGTRDGLAIAIAIAEALVDSRALVWFATHFRELASILSERNGAVNLHLAVDNSKADRMEMLYRVSSGAVQEKHYGIKMARVLPLPPDVIEHAELVSSTIDRLKQSKAKPSLTIVTARKRKLMLNLKEHLVQARNGPMDDETLKGWLEELQSEFIVQMMALDDEEGRIVRGGARGLDDGRDSDVPRSDRERSTDAASTAGSNVVQSIEQDVRGQLQEQSIRDLGAISRSASCVDTVEHASVTLLDQLKRGELLP